MMALMFGGMWYLMSVRAQGGMGPDRMAKFGSAQIRGLSEKDKQVTFADVAGADEEKEELREIVEFLKIQRSISIWAPGSPRACCWWALRAPARRC